MNAKRKRYSVLLLCPDYAAEVFGQDTHYYFVTARSPREAIAVARRLAMKDHDTYEQAQPEDFFVLLVSKGHNRDINPAF